MKPHNSLPESIYVTYMVVLWSLDDVSDCATTVLSITLVINRPISQSNPSICIWMFGRGVIGPKQLLSKLTIYVYYSHSGTEILEFYPPSFGSRCLPGLTRLVKLNGQK